MNGAARLASLSSKELLTYDMGYASEWRQKRGKSTWLVGKTGNDERKERNWQMVIGRRARASVGFTISFETLSMEAITDTGTS